MNTNLSAGTTSDSWAALGKRWPQQRLGGAKGPPKQQGGWRYNGCTESVLESWRNRMSSLKPRLYRSDPSLERLFSSKTPPTANPGAHAASPFVFHQLCAFTYPNLRLQRPSLMWISAAALAAEVINLWNGYFKPSLYGDLSDLLPFCGFTGILFFPFLRLNMSGIYMPVSPPSPPWTNICDIWIFIFIFCSATFLNGSQTSPQLPHTHTGSRGSRFQLVSMETPAEPTNQVARHRQAGDLIS